RALPVARSGRAELVDEPRRARPPARAPLGRSVVAELRSRVRTRRLCARSRAEAHTRGRVIALLGNLTRDLIPGEPARPGGGVFHGARALRQLGVRAHIYARCAPTDRAELFRPLVRLG